MKKIIAFFLFGLLSFGGVTFAADTTTQTNDKQISTEVKESNPNNEKQNITIININRTWFCFINKGFKTQKN